MDCLQLFDDSLLIKQDVCLLVEGALDAVDPRHAFVVAFVPLTCVFQRSTVAIIVTELPARALMNNKRIKVIQVVLLLVFDRTLFLAFAKFGGMLFVYGLTHVIGEAE